MNRPREYSKRKLFHAWISERLLKIVAALPKFQGGVLRQLQRFHEYTVKRVWMNCLPSGSNLYLETISLPVMLTFEEWREIQGKFAKELCRYRAKGSIHTPDNNKVNETIENINNATIHSKSWSDFGYISFKEAKSFLADATDVVNVRLFSFSKGHIFIVYQVHLSETLKSELNSYFQLQFPVMIFLIPTLKHFLRHWGLRSENGILYKRFKVQDRLNSIRKKLHNEISKKLHLPVRDSYPIPAVDIYVLNSVEKNIFQYEFWSCLGHAEYSQGFFTIPNDSRYTLSVPSASDDHTIKIVGHQNHFTLENEYRTLSGQILHEIEYFIDSLLPTWNYHVLYFNDSDRIAHLRFKLSKMAHSWFGIKLFKTQKFLLGQNFDRDMLSKDYDIEYFLRDISTGPKFTEKIPNEQGGNSGLTDYLRDGIKYFKKSYRQSRREISEFLKAYVDIKNANINTIIQLVVLLFATNEFFDSSWAKSFSDRVVEIWYAIQTFLSGFLS